MKHFVKLRTSKTYREENQSVAIVGKKMIDELSKRLPVKTLAHTGNLSFHARAVDSTVTVSQKILKKMTGVVSPDGCIAEFALPALSPLTQLDSILILDQIQDPGNVGTLIRSAVAFGFKGIYFVEGSVDPFNEKALRASKGAIFDIAINKGSWETFFSQVQTVSPYTLYRADFDGEDIRTAKIQSPFALILGNEGTGVSQEAKVASTALTIPICSKIESLNVAAAGSICMFMMRT